ncbi:hypothetical protein ABZ897_46225 [Nonomuraea sp. NPDC046802]|uniref:hypothetical protein n=1 Tax=Nonomuraea sp. NPDC046802 TaxID=3154919 RepID=UPI0033D8F3C6
MSVGAAVVGLAAAAAIAVPLLTGTERPAYAVTKNTDGTVSVLIKEFRDADKLQQDLGKLGIPADITYRRPGKTCGPDRGRLVEGKMGMGPEAWAKSVHRKVAELVNDDEVAIHPQYIGDNQTLVMEITEKNGLGPKLPREELVFRGLLIAGKVKPCVLVDANYELRGSPTPSPSAGG